MWGRGEVGIGKEGGRGKVLGGYENERMDGRGGDGGRDGGLE